MEIVLSLLIPTIHRRLRTTYPGIIEELHQQSKGLPVEILGFYDNQMRPVGEKRNGLLSLSQGTYMAFVDDDDRVAPTYVSDILQVIQNNHDVDVVCFLSECRINGGPAILCRYSLSHKIRIHTGDTWMGPPAHTMVWRREPIRNVLFSSKNYSEDNDWVNQAVQCVQTESQIDKVLYYYDFNSTDTATRG